MKTYRFTVILKGIPVIDEEIADRLYEAGCDDCSPFSRDGVTGAGFDREAVSLEAAISSAVADVRRAGYEIDRVEIDQEEVAQLGAA